MLSLSHQGGRHETIRQTARVDLPARPGRCQFTGFCRARRKAAKAAEAAQPALIETLRDMVMIESGSGDAEGLAKMADFTETRLKALGAKTERRKATRGTGADIVIGTFEGTGSKKLMLMA